jgi:hypothetical protein
MAFPGHHGGRPVVNIDARAGERFAKNLKDLRKFPLIENDFNY